MVKGLLVVTAISFALGVNAQSQPPAPAPSKKGETPHSNAAKHQKLATPDQRGTEASPLVIKVIPPKESQPPAEGKPYKHYHEAATDWWMVIPTILLAIFTFGLFSYAALQSGDIKRSLAVSKRAADAAKISADTALLGAMPFLHPVAKILKLYPGDTAPRHRPELAIEFQNIGKTPAILDKVGVMLILTEEDGLPPIPPAIGEIPTVERSDVIPQGAAKIPKADWQFYRDINEDEIRRLIREAEKGNNFMRFYAAGYVVYHDIFGYRTTQRFCMKLRQSGFQPMRGGNAYNEIKREKQPEGEAPGKAAETA